MDSAQCILIFFNALLQKRFVFFFWKTPTPTLRIIFKFLSFFLDTRICAFLLALNTVLPPISAGYRYKPTISVAQEDTVVFARNEEDAASKIQTIYSAYAERSLPVVPKLVVFGDDLNRMIGRFFVYYGDIQYELPSAARALDVLIKFTAVLGLPYSKQSKLVWYSISDIVYRIPQRELYASCVKLRKNLTADSSS